MDHRAVTTIAAHALRGMTFKANLCLHSRFQLSWARRARKISGANPWLVEVMLIED
ncbi:MAG TPA: hypothetical protein VFV82_10920 [Candidatus Binatia bacterium]|nr:hypothetical protein [Candidatus Binatia bacterium]